MSIVVPLLASTTVTLPSVVYLKHETHWDILSEPVQVVTTLVLAVMFPVVLATMPYLQR